MVSSHFMCSLCSICGYLSISLGPCVFLLCRCDVISAAVLPAGLHHLPHPPQTHLPHPLTPPWTHRQKLRPQRSSTGPERRRRPIGPPDQEPQQEAEPKFGQQSEEDIQQPGRCSRWTWSKKVRWFVHCSRCSHLIYCTDQGVAAFLSSFSQFHVGCSASWELKILSSFWCSEEFNL